jgi:ankyrin repeat protein
MGMILAKHQRLARERIEIEAEILKYCAEEEPELWVQQALRAEDPPNPPEDSGKSKGSSPSKSEASTAASSPPAKGKRAASGEGEDEEDEEEHPVFGLIRRGRNDEAQKELLSLSVCEKQDKFGDTPLHTCCEVGNETLARWLIRRRGELDEQNYLGWTPLHTSVFHAQLGCIELLMDCHAKVEEVDYEGRGVLHIAAEAPKVYHLNLVSSTERFKRRRRRVAEFKQQQTAQLNKSKELRMIRKMIEQKERVGDTAAVARLQEKLKMKQREQQGLRAEGPEMPAGPSGNKMPTTNTKAMIALAEIKEKYQSLWKHTPNRLEVIILARLFGDPFVKQSGALSVAKKCSMKVNLKDFQGNTALHLACKHGWKEFSSRLMHDKASIEAEDGKMNRPLHHAVQRGAVEVVEMLLGCQANVNATNHLFTTPLHIATENMDMQCLKLLVNAAADTGAYNAEGLTPLMIAMQRKETYIFRAIMESSPCLDSIDTRGWNIAIYGVRNHMLKEVVEHLEHMRTNNAVVEALFHYQDPQGYTALHHAVLMQDPKLVDTILQLDEANDKDGRCTMCKDANGNLALHLAAQSGDLTIIQAVAFQTLNMDARNHFGETPLLITALKGNYAAVLYLMSSRRHIVGADAGAVDIWGRTFLMRCAMSGNLDLVNMVLYQRKNREADFTFEHMEINQSDKEGCTALALASREGHWRVISSLVSQGANLSNKDRDGWSALHWAANAAEDRVCLTLIDCFADLNGIDAKGWTPLMHAVDQEHFSTAAILVDAKADLRCVNFNGDTVLTMAARDSVDCLELLCDRMREIDSGKGRPLNSLDYLHCRGHLMVTLKRCGELWLEGTSREELNTYAVLQLCNEGQREYTLSSCDMGTNEPKFHETFRFELPQVTPSTRIVVLVMATYGDKAQVMDRMSKTLGRATPLRQKELDEQKKINQLMAKFGRLKTKADRVKMLEAQKRAEELAEQGIEQQNVPAKRWDWISLLWRHAGLGNDLLPPVSREDAPIGFTIVHPALLRNCVLSCETGEPAHLQRALRGSVRGWISFEVDYRRHFSPDIMNSDPPPLPSEESYLNAKQPPLWDRSTPTIPWGTMPRELRPDPPTSLPNAFPESPKEAGQRGSMMGTAFLG